MPEPMRLGLDNPIFSGRLRAPQEISFDKQTTEELPAKNIAKSLVPVWMRPLSKPKPMPGPEPARAMPSLASLVIPRPLFVSDTAPQQRRFSITVPEQLARMRRPTLDDLKQAFNFQDYTKLQKALLAMAALVFILGVGVSLQALRTNRGAVAQVAALSKKTQGQEQGNNQNSAVPSTTKPSSKAVSSYHVASDLPRYIKIPKLRVYARVFQVGETRSGALGTPGNVYDTAWYAGSAKPGQPGAMLIDGHISSWTTHGVFYGLKRLIAGDTIQIQRGDGQTFNYRVVKTQVYSDNNVDMQAAITPITAGKPGLNLVSCTGRVKPGTSEFNQRIIVFAEQI